MAEQPQFTEGTRLVERNVQALIDRRQQNTRQRSGQDRAADAISRFAGSMKFVYLHLVFFGAWVIWNLPFVPLPRFDPTYVMLGMFASTEAIFLSTFVLITQNRMMAESEKRAELDLQISLLAEHEITKLIQIVSAIGEQMQVAPAKDPELDEFKRDIAPENVLDTIERRNGGA